MDAWPDGAILESSSAVGQSRDSSVRLSLDVWSAKLLAWTASFGRDVDLTPEAHLFFFDRYVRLAEHHRKRGHAARARRLTIKAGQHSRAGGGDGPSAAAMALPRPRRLVRVHAVAGAMRNDSPDDAA